MRWNKIQHPEKLKDIKPTSELKKEQGTHHPNHSETT